MAVDVVQTFGSMIEFQGRRALVRSGARLTAVEAHDLFHRIDCGGAGHAIHHMLAEPIQIVFRHRSNPFQRVKPGKISIHIVNGT